MKKISTLAVALMTLGSLVTPAQADKVLTSTLPSGYYKIKSKKEAATHLKKYVFNDFTVSGNGNNVSLMSATEGGTNNYLWKITNDGKSATIGIVNGQGSPITREDGNHGAGAGGIKSYSYLTPSNLTDLTNVLFKEYLHSPQDGDGNHKYGTDDLYKGVAFWDKTDNETTRWVLTKVDVDAKAYTVSVVTTSTSTTKPYITRTLTDGTKEYAFNSGFFISDADLDKASLTASTLEGYETPSINVDNTAKTVTAYYAKFDDLTALITSARELLNTRGIGYPLSTSDAHVAFASVIGIASSNYTAESSAKDIAEAYTILQNAITNYRSTTEGIQMPEDGKVYKMYGLNGTNKYYAKNGENQNFVVQKIKDGTYRFVSTSGDQKGYTFDNDKIDLDLKVYRRINFGALNLASGTVSIGISSNGSTGKFSNNSYVGTISGVGYSTEIYFEEVADFAGQPVNFAASTDSKNYATLNLPYASKLPEGVTAYKATVEGTTVNLTEYKTENKVLPANTPVLLTATTAGSKTFAPAAYEAADNRTGFQGTLAATAVNANNTYILSQKDGKVNFFALDGDNNTINANKAYLVVSAGGAQALNFNFGNTTGIQNAAVEGVNANAPLFDLSGRRVVKAVKGGIYIQNGKKFVK